ncbi:hypothetical protein [Synechococcus phage S-B05]|nr:hypothetical protein [Synechococcus phage S-B05]
MYKIIEQNLKVIQLISKNAFFKVGDNRYFKKFLEDVSNDGLGIVEGPDVIEPSYSELRRQEYPSREDQFDMQFHDQVNGTTTWKDTIQAIKDKYPKTITGGTSIGPIPDWVQEEVDKYNSSL